MKTESKINALRIGSDGQYKLRKTIIRMHESGKTGIEIANHLGVSPSYVSLVKKLYEEGGAEALKPAQRGRPAGTSKVLTPDQQSEIKNIITNMSPEQFGFAEGRWTRNNIHNLIFEKYGNDIKSSTLSYYLAQWKFTCKHSPKKA